MQAQLRVTKRLSDRLDAIENELAALSPATTKASEYESPEDFIEALSDDPGEGLDALKGARERWPDSEALACTNARALWALGVHTEADALLSDFVQAREGADEAAALRAELMLRAGKRAELLEWLSGTRGELPPRLRFMRAQALEQSGDLDGCLAELMTLHEQDPEAPHVRRYLSRVQRLHGEFDAALAELDALVAGAEPGPDDWDRMEVATVLDRWDVVRASAARLEMEVEGEQGPIEERWGLFLLRLDLAEGGSEDVLAMRLGPVHAEVVRIDPPGEVQRFEDRHVFEAKPLEEPPEDEEADKTHLHVYRAVHKLSDGGFVAYSLDGVDPGEAWVEALREGLAEMGGYFSVRSDESYQLEVDGKHLQGLYGFIAVPGACEPTTLHALLTDACEGLEHPLVWLELGNALDDDAERERQRQIVERYGL